MKTMKIVSKNRLLVGTAVLTLVSGGLYGCKDFLSTNAVPQGTLDAGTLANKAGVEGTLIGAYRALDCTNNTSGPGWGCAASNWVFGSVAADDSYKGSTNTDQPPINDIEGYHWGGPQGQIYINQKWTLTYEGVVRANSTLRLLKTVVAASPGEFSAADAHAVEGEALFLRAHYHFEAYRMWGNVPYYREDDTDFRKANETSDAVVVDLLKDLDSAIKLLPTTPRSKGRASQWTAKAYKGRVQVYAGQYAAAVATLQDVKTNGPYALETSYDHVWTGFKQFADGPETIFAYQASSNDGEPNGNNANFGERLNFPYFTHFGCCGFNQPSFNLVNFYQVDPAGLPLALSNPNTWNVNSADFTAANTAPVDPRLDWTVGREGVPYKDWGLYNSNMVRDVGNGGPYSPKKNAHEQASGSEQIAGGWSPTQQNSVHIHLYRYADALLLLAEAQVETNDLVGALANVNLVRARAGVTAQGCGYRPTDASIVVPVGSAYPGCVGDTRLAVPINDPSIKWAVYKVNPYPVFPTQAYAREAVRTERRLELAMEGQRLFDLRRWGLAYAAAAINGYINGEGGGAEKTRITYKASADAFAQKHLLFPIPYLQVELSKTGTTDNLKQNTGW
jgi:hypothetical protein